jgi:hypothetical protein
MSFFGGTKHGKNFMQKINFNFFLKIESCLKSNIEYV